ncbi:MAG: FliG C-terminal domain-containing protein [Pseudomonadota bacterium]
MTDSAEMVREPTASPPADPSKTVPTEPLLTSREKAAVILGVLGTDAASPILEQMDEDTLRSFASAMSRLKRVSPETVMQTIAEFQYEVDRLDMTVMGGAPNAREMLRDAVNDATLTKIFDDIESPSVHNVWNKLAKVDDGALADFLMQEHPQTVAVVLSKLSVEQSARLIGHLDEDRAREVVTGLTKTSKLDPQIIETIGTAVSRSFLENQRGSASGFKPADRIGAIMNYAPGNIRQSVLAYLDETQPEFSDKVKRKMFTFQDIPKRLEKRDIAAVVRAVDGDVLLTALVGAGSNAADTRDFILASISSRVAEQLRADMAEVGKVKIREAEEAQNAILAVIRELETNAQIMLVPLDD